MITRRLRIALAVTTALWGPAVLSEAAAQNLPSGPSVGAQAGSSTVTFTQPNSQTLNIGLGNNTRTIINWNSFDVASGYTTQFQYSGGSRGAVLNRVIGGNYSLIDGSLLGPSNLDVYVLNPNGFLFGTGANVNVGGLVVSTLGIADADFMDGSPYNFTGVGSIGFSVASGAQINASSGPLVLLGGWVSNSGALTAAGDVAIAAASDVSMAVAAGSPISMTINQGTPVTGGVVAGGTINGANVYLAVASRAGVTNALLNVSGAITATSATATDRGIVLAAGTSASGVTVASGGGNDTGGGAGVTLSGGLNASRNVEVATSGSVSGSGTVNAELDVTAVGNQGVAIGSVVAGSDILLSGGAGGVGSSSNLSLTAGGNVTIIGAARGLDIAISADGNVTTDSLTARDDIVVRAGGAASLGNSVSGSTVDALPPVDVSFSADMLAGATVAGHDVDIVANGLRTGSIQANGSTSDVRLNSGTGAIGQGSQDLSVTAGGNVVLAGAAKGRDVALNAGGSVTTDSVTTRDDIVIRAGGAVTTGYLFGGTTVDSLGTVDTIGAADVLSGMTLTGADIVIDGTGVSLGGAWANGVGSDARLNASPVADLSSSGVIIGDTVELTGGNIGASNARVQTAANNLSLLGGNGAVYVSEADGVTLTSGQAATLFDFTAAGNITTTSGITAAAGDVRLAATNGGDMTLGANVIAGGGGSIYLTADGMLGRPSGASLMAQDLFLTAGDFSGGILSSAALQETGNVTIRDTAGGLTISSMTGLSATNALTIETLGGALSVGGVTAGGGVTLTSATDLAISGPIAAGAGESTQLVAGGNITQTAPLAATLLHGSAGGTVNLTNAGNQVTALGDFSSAGLTLVNMGGLSISGAVGAGAGNATVVTTGGDLTIASTGSVAGATVTLSTDERFLNNSGSDAIAASDRWLVYSAAPTGNSYGGLDSGNAAIWNAAYGSFDASSVSGNRYLFVYQPTLTFTALNDNKTYGTALSTSAYSVTGYHAGVAGAFLGDTAASAYAGAPLLSSTGYAANADVAGGPYAISIGAGSLTSPSGYAFNFAGNAALSIDPKAITGSVTVNDKTYDGTTAATGSVTLNGVVAGDSVSGSASYAFADKNAGTGKTVNVTNGSLSGADAGNYTLTLPATVLADILQKAITGSVTVNDKTYDGTTAATGSVTLNGVVAGDSVSGSASYAFADKNAGTGKTVNVTNGSLSGADAGNYTLTLPATVLADILQRVLVIAANDATKVEDQPDPAFTYALIEGSLVAGESLSGALNREAGEAPGLYEILQGSLTAGQNYAITFQSGTLTITALPPSPSPRIQPLRASPLPAQVRAPSKGRSLITVQPGVFCEPRQPCPSR